MIVFSSVATCAAGLLDAVDGHAARLLGQSSKFGAMLDMLTDRCATMCLLTTLATFYPAAIFLFQLSMVIDISCHWLHIHTALLQGATSHKFVDPTGNYWMRLYYTDRRVLFAMCAGNGRTAASYCAVALQRCLFEGNELFYAMLYLCHFTSGPLHLFLILAVLCFPVAVTKSGIALLQVSSPQPWQATQDDSHGVTDPVRLAVRSLRIVDCRATWLR